MLFKSAFRTLKDKYVQLILLGIIITLSSFIYTTMDYGVGGILQPTENYFDEANQEDFAISMMDLLLEEDYQYINQECTSDIEDDIHTLSGLRNVSLSCYNQLMNHRIQIIQNNTPDIDIELREYKDVYYDFNGSAHRIRFLKDSERINTSYLVKGVKPSNADEIAVAEAYAKANDLKIGDLITISNHNYVISGYVLFSDYSLALFDQQLIFDNETQTLGLLYDQQFESISSPIGFDLMGDLKEVKQEVFKDDVVDTYRDNEDLSFLTNIVFTQNNMRSGAIYGEIEGGQAMGLGLSLIIASIALLIVGIMVSKVLQSQRGPIGILKSMGYSRFQITMPYIFIIGILAFPAILLGYILGVFAAEPMKNIYLIFYLLPSQPIQQELTTFLIAVIVPFVFLIVVAYLIIHHLLNQKPVELLNPKVSKSANQITKVMSKAFKKLSIIKKLRQLLLFRSFVKFMVFLIGMFYAAFLIFISLAMFGMFDRMITDYYDQTNHNYIGYCQVNTTCIEPGEGQEKVIELPSVLLDNDEVQLVGIEPSSQLHPLINSRGDNVISQLEDGLIITESLHLKQGFDIGDKLVVDFGTSSFEIEVVSITEEYTGDKAYISRKILSDELTGNQDYHNVIYASEPLDAADFALIVSTDKILNQTQKMQEFMDVTIYILIFASIIIGAIIVYILSMMTIEDNFYNISLFKVLGYNQKEISKMILGGYSFYGMFIFVIAAPISYFVFEYIALFFAREYNVVMPFEFGIIHSLIGLGIFIILFNTGAWISKKKLTKISLQEAMKMYRV